MSINVCDTKVSMLFSLLLANILISSCFLFLLLVIIKNTVVGEKIKGKLVPVIPIGASTILTEEIIQTPPLVALKTIETLSV